MAGEREGRQAIVKRPTAPPAAATAVMEDLKRLAAAQPSTRQGGRWAVELARAAATIEQVYGLGAADE
jgi:hypothetical protein